MGANNQKLNSHNSNPNPIDKNHKNSPKRKIFHEHLHENREPKEVHNDRIVIKKELSVR